MPLSTAAKAVLCLCPPVAIAGAVATVPAAKRVAHHLTAAHPAARPIRHLATAPATPAEQAMQRVDCDPVIAGPLPAVPLVTYAAPIPDEPGGPGAGPGGGVNPGVGVIGAQAAVSPGPAAATPVPPTGAPAGPSLPEPASWAMLIAGAGTIGLTLRRRRHSGGRGDGRIAAGAALGGMSTVAEAGDVAATVAAKSTIATVAGKAMLCVCPAAVVAGSVVAVPPLRHAVHTATAPATVPAPAPAGAIRSAVPCDQPMPVSATAVKGFPDIVTLTDAS